MEKFSFPLIGKVKARLRPLRYVPKIFRELWRIGKVLVCASLVLRISLAGLPVVILWVSKLLIDAIIHVQSNSSSWTAIVVLFLAEFSLMIVSDALSRLSGHVDTLLSDRFTHRMSVRVLEHAAELDLEAFENPVFQDRLERATKQTSSQFAVLISLAQIIQTTVGVISMIAAVALYAPWLVLLQAGAVLPVVLAETYYATVLHKLYQERTSQRRAMEYLLSLGTGNATAKEIKAFNLGQHLIAEYDQIGGRFIREDAVLSRKRNLVGGILTSLGSAAYYAGYGYLVWEAAHKAITIGTLFFLSGAFQRAKGQLQGLFSTLTRTLDQGLYLTDVFEFFEMKPRITSAGTARRVRNPIRCGFEFRDVSFAYAGARSETLHRITFSIAPGETIALVGENGAGKTTLIKLLARLYEPTEGVIYLDGIDLREYDIESLREAISMVFQDFVRFDMTVRENIAFGDLRAKGDLARLQQAARDGLALPLVERLPKKFDQLVGKRFDGGVELSGGEWQKLALARACMRNAQLLILDEPAAALDPRSEHALFQHFARLTDGKMAVLISHRFSTVRMADRILVLEKGRLREQGTHSDLIAKGGEYSALFRLQAAGYQADFGGRRSSNGL